MNRQNLRNEVFFFRFVSQLNKTKPGLPHLKLIYTPFWIAPAPGEHLPLGMFQKNVYLSTKGG